MTSLAGKETLLDMIKGASATLVLFLAFTSIPVAGLVPGLMAPLPGCYYAFKSGKWTGLAIAVITVAVLAAVGDQAALILYLLMTAPVSLLLPLFLKEGKGGAKPIAYTVTINLALIAAAAAAYGIVHGVDLDTQVQKGLESSLSQTASLYEKGGLKGDELKALQQGVMQAGALIGKIYPAMMIVTLINIAGLNLMAMRSMRGRLPALPAIGEFRAFKNPEQLVWVVIVAGFAMLVPYPDVTRTALNVLIVTLFMYFLQGFAVIVSFFTRLAVPVFVRAIFYILLALQPYLAAVIAALGIFDIWGDFRTPKQRENL